MFDLGEIYEYTKMHIGCILVDSGIAAGLAQAPSVAQGDHRPDRFVAPFTGP